MIFLRTLKGNHFLRIWNCNNKQRNWFSRHERNLNIYNDLHKKIPKKIVFFGTDNFSLESLKLLYFKKQEGLIDKLQVVTQLKKPCPPVPKFCMESDLPFSEWPLNSSLKDFDIGIVVSFGHLIPQEVIASFPLGILNVHGSLLPRWRGSSPIVHAILNGDKETGVTIMNIHPHKFDVGEILHQKIIPIQKNMKTLELTQIMAEVGAKCLIHCLSNVQEFINKSTPQPNIGITNAPKIKKEDSEILWDKMTPDVINSMYLAYDEYFPLWSKWHGTVVKFKDISRWEMDESFSTKPKDLTVYRYIKRLRKDNKRTKDSIEKDIEHAKGSQNTFGQVRYMKKENTLQIKCLGGFVYFKSILVVGKKKMSAVDFQNGFISKVNFTKHYFY